MAFLLSRCAFDARVLYSSIEVIVKWLNGSYCQYIFPILA